MSALTASAAALRFCDRVHERRVHWRASAVGEEKEGGGVGAGFEQIDHCRGLSLRPRQRQWQRQWQCQCQGQGQWRGRNRS